MALTEHRYVALLRGVNVGGHAILKMADLRQLFASLGFKEISTYIQSGNVIFSAGDAGRAAIVRKIEDGLASLLGHEVRALVFTRAELKEAAAHNPFDPQRRDKEQRCQLMFLIGEPEEKNVAALMAMQKEEYSFFIHDKVLYYAYARENEGRRRRSIDFERVLGVAGTSRSWKVVDKLIELSG